VWEDFLGTFEGCNALKNYFFGYKLSINKYKLGNNRSEALELGTNILTMKQKYKVNKNDNGL